MGEIKIDSLYSSSLHTSLKLEQISVEHFLRGLLDKRAEAVAMDKNPKQLHKAIKYLKDAVNNRNLKPFMKSYRVRLLSRG